MLNRINYSILTGHIRDSETNKPINANIAVKGIDDQGSYRKPYQSNNTYGTYYRFLKDGSYTVIFSSEKYYPDTFDVVITETGPTVLDVSLVRNSDNIIISKKGYSTAKTKTVLKTPKNGLIVLLLPFIYKSNAIEIYNSQGKKIDFTISENVNKDSFSLTLDISHLPSGIYFMRFANNSNNYIYTFII
jgi:hypothetical protein